MIHTVSINCLHFQCSENVPFTSLSTEQIMIKQNAYKRIGYDLNVMRLSTCLVINPITVDNFATF